MSQQVSLVQDGLDRFNSAFDSLGGEVQRFQKQVRTRRKSLEKEFDHQRKTFEKRTRKQVNRIRVMNAALNVALRQESAQAVPVS